MTSENTSENTSTVPSPVAFGIMGVFALAITFALLNAGAGVLGWLLLVLGTAVIAACVIAFGVSWGLDLHEQNLAQRAAAKPAAGTAKTSGTAGD